MSERKQKKNNYFCISGKCRKGHHEKDQSKWGCFAWRSCASNDQRLRFDSTRCDSKIGRRKKCFQRKFPRIEWNNGRWHSKLSIVSCSTTFLQSKSSRTTGFEFLYWFSRLKRQWFAWRTYSFDRSESHRPNRNRSFATLAWNAFFS